MATTDEIFLPGGLLDRGIPDYSPRDGQIEMAETVTEAFRDGRIAVLEAGTGTGKSYAYLAPAMEILRTDPSARVIVATSTITLQKQLYDKDIPLLTEVLGTDPSPAILYGRGNYVCIKRVEDLKLEEGLELEDPASDLHHVACWMAETESGSIWDNDDWQVRRAWREIMSDDRKCDGARCPYLPQCFYYRARKQAMASRLLVTNHHLFLIDTKHRMETDTELSDDAILPGYTHAVLDEAHHLEDEATEILSARYSREILERQLDFITFRNRKQGNLSLLDMLSPYASTKSAVSEIYPVIKRVRDHAEAFEKASWETLSAVTNDEILFTPELFQHFRPLVDRAGDLGDELHDLHLRLMDLYDDEQIPDEDRTGYENVLRTGAVISGLSDALMEFSTFSSFSARIPYIERNRKDRTLTVRICPMDVGPILRHVVYDNIRSMIFCSATLAVNGSFEFYRKRVGLLDMDPVTKSFPSPFNYRENLMLLLPHDGAMYRQNDTSGEFRKYIVDSCVRALSASCGGALVLFTNRKQMEACWEEVAAILPGMQIYCQGRDYGRDQLLRRFKNEKDSCLFATASFWEGIDAPGDTLRLVIIVKIPFPVPSQPIFQARSMSVGDRAFAELSIPDAAIRLKQGIGRLIRTEQDRGVVIILDNRMMGKGYGQHLLHSLPDCFVPEDVTIDSLERRIESFLF